VTLSIGKSGLRKVIAVVYNRLHMWGTDRDCGEGLDGYSLTFKHVSATIEGAHGESYAISRRICETNR
jgi:hypothetical protein